VFEDLLDRGALGQKASTVMRPPQRSQRKTSMPKTRSRDPPQGIRVGAFATAGGIATEDTAGAGAPEAGARLGEAGLQRAPSWIEKTFGRLGAFGGRLRHKRL